MQKFQLDIPGTHTKEEVGHKLFVANIAGLFLTVFTGASVAPWAWDLLRWAGSHVPIWTPLPFPNLFENLLHPNWVTGLTWLIYYVVSYVTANFLLSPRQKAAIARYVYRTTIAFDRRPSNQALWQQQRKEEVLGPYLYRPVPNEDEEDDDEYSLLHGYRSKKAPLLSQAWPGEEKHDLVKQCYDLYRRALGRYEPAPLELKTPDTFFYHNRKTLGYNGPTPILPEELLTPANIKHLQPMLAQHLYWYNLESIGPTHLPTFTPDFVPWPWLLVPTGNWLWIPVWARQNIEDDLRDLYTIHQKALILEADAFAALLGQGPALEQQLRVAQRAMRQAGFTDVSEPTLSERIGHLEALNKQERAEMRALGLKPKEPPRLLPPQTPK